jgi:zinc transporter ZupT
MIEAENIASLYFQHNFTDGMALGSAFLNHGTIGGWSRTLFLLAHEIPQEVNVQQL